MRAPEIAGGSERTGLDGNHGRLHEKALRVAALLASAENGGRVELRHWARAQEMAERWRLYAHRLYRQVTGLQVSRQAEIEEKLVEAVRRWQGTDRYSDGLTAADIARFVWGLGAVEVKHYADGLVASRVLERHKPGRAERYFVPRPDPEGETGEAERNRCVEVGAEHLRSAQRVGEKEEE